MASRRYRAVAANASPLFHGDGGWFPVTCATDRKSTRLNSSHQIISYAVFCLKKKISPLSLFRQLATRDEHLYYTMLYTIARVGLSRLGPHVRNTNRMSRLHTSLDELPSPALV